MSPAALHARRVRILATCIGVVELGGAGLARAQQEPGVEIERVVVTARRREESAQTVPISVAVFDQEQLRQANIARVNDLQFVTPGLSIGSGSAGVRNVPIYTIRGQGQTATLAGQDPSVGIYFADLAQARLQGSNAAFFDLESVQVLKGPQGTLFGRNTTGGAILITPSKPRDSFDASVSVGATGFDGGAGGSTEFMVNTPLSPKVLVRMSGRFVRRDGFVKDVHNGQELNDEESNSWRVSALIKPRDEVESVFVYNHLIEDIDGSATVITDINPNSTAARLAFTGAAPYFLPSLNDAFARQRNRDFRTTESARIHGPNQDLLEEYDVRSVSNTTSWSAENFTLKAIVGYRLVDEHRYVDWDGTPAGVLDSETFFNGNQRSAELQASGNWYDNRINWTTGLYYFKESGSDRSLSYSLDFPVVRTNPFLSGGDYRNESYAAFAQMTAAIGAVEGLSITTGFRQTWDERWIKSVARNPIQCRIIGGNGAPLPSDACEKSVSKKFDSPTWTISLEYQANPTTLWYLAHRRGYRSGGFNLRAETVDQFAPFDPETVSDLELGVKVDWTLGAVRGRFNGAGYYQDYKDIQRSVTYLAPSGSIASGIINAASATLYGAEFELTLIPVPSLEISAGYSYIDAGYDRFTTATADLSRNKFAFVPEHQGNLALTYHLPIASRVGQLAAQVRAYGQSKAYYHETNQGPAFGRASTQYAPSYTLVDVRLDWTHVAGRPIDAALYVKNAFDEEFGTMGGIFYPTLGLNVTAPNDPRIFGIDVRYRF